MTSFQYLWSCIRRYTHCMYSYTNHRHGSNSHYYKLAVRQSALWNTQLSFCLSDLDSPIPYILLTMCTDILLSQQPCFSNKKSYSWHDSAAHGNGKHGQLRYYWIKLNTKPIKVVKCALPYLFHPWHESYLNMFYNCVEVYRWVWAVTFHANIWI